MKHSDRERIDIARTNLAFQTAWVTLAVLTGILFELGIVISQLKTIEDSCGIETTADTDQ